MAYEKQNFQPLTELKAEQLNKMDNQIFETAKKVDMTTPIYVGKQLPAGESGPCILVKPIN